MVGPKNRGKKGPLGPKGHTDLAENRGVQLRLGEDRPGLTTDRTPLICALPRSISMHSAHTPGPQCKTIIQVHFSERKFLVPSRN